MWAYPGHYSIIIGANRTKNNAESDSGMWDINAIAHFFQMAKDESRLNGIMYTY